MSILRGMVALDKKKYVKTKFSKVTRRYDLVNTLGSLGVDHWWRYLCIRELKAYPGPILDLCAGTLTLSKEIVRQRPRPVVALDITYEMLSYGKLRLARHPALSFIFPVVGDAEKLPFSANQFWGASVAFGIRNLADPEKGLKEVLRTLKPGGKFVILEFSRPTLPGFSHLYRLYLNKFMPLLGGNLTGDREAYEYLADSIEKFPAPEEFSLLMKNCGFKKVKYFQLSFGIVTIYTGLKP
ncbi:ubiquinone/menaquinone biosynthesis methyltransferase [Thermodesulfatator indicus DSM 15286]|uniref:Demethylmenaquinone methyltransferase n=1 Tax=Thermodesulfatator indicus (strain DSM 15286 / JCM 11887 / CIR29812) TaxID=667014 RepID=F8A8C3_THEID|nr:ubiquinone/menaquinone biosynthesis methyltransferase [Thermodesulfatator indicus DSM 15286]